MNKHEEIRKELREIAPNLEKLEKGNPFRTPDYYFQSLPDKIAEKVKGSATPPMWTDRAEKWLNNFFSMIFQPRVAIPVAALMLGLVVGISLFRANNNVAFDVSQPLSKISTEEIDEYVIENFDDADLMALGESTGQLNGFIPSDIPKDELEDFLQNNTDNQTLEEEIL